MVSLAVMPRSLSLSRGLARPSARAISTKGVRHLMPEVTEVVETDSWAPERLGLYNRNPLRDHSSSLGHRPGKVNRQKHTFDREYFRSTECKALLKVAYAGSVEVECMGGLHQAVAKRDLRVGEIVERGILRGFDPEAVPEGSNNPAVLRLGQDFLTGPAFPWSEYSARPGPPFLPSGCLAQYAASHSNYNVELKVRESHIQGFEFEAVAAEDVPEGTPLVRRVAKAAAVERPHEAELHEMTHGESAKWNWPKANAASRPRYGDIYEMSDEDVERYVSFYGEMDAEIAAKAGSELDTVHAETIAQHARLTRTGEIPVVDCQLTVCLPHPVWPGFGVFALRDISAGSVIESGVMSQVFELNGDKNPYVFTWNRGGKRFTDGRENTWCTGSGNSMFYNSDNPSNCRMYRFYDHHRYLIVAKVNIKEGEEVMHLYASSSWRKCFVADDYLPKLLPVEQADKA